MSTLLVIVPAFNEERTVGPVVTELQNHGFDVVVVDDGSIDETASKAGACGVRVLRLPINLGVGGALKCGFNWAVDHGYRRVVQCDADGQHRADQIAALVRAQETTNAHLVIGSRFTSGQTWRVRGIRRVAMRLMARLASRASGIPVTDSTSGFRLIGEPLLSAFARAYPTHYLGDTFEALVTTGRAGYRVVEVPAVLEERKAGRASAPPLASLRYVIRALLITTLGLQVKIAPYRPESGSVAVASSPLMPDEGQRLVHLES
jgi:glycosyltransferase involved in cell wall biosynthesis